jgi:muramidase (phage lysozyme)
MEEKQKSSSLKPEKKKGVEALIGPIAALLGFICLMQWLLYGTLRGGLDPIFSQKQPPLVMKGGDPYIRALMRTISASEANSKRPYSLLYGGKHVEDLSRHPEVCVTIVNGPNKGNCSTAAGRYQVINKTWYRIAQKYHPNPSRVVFWSSYNFDAQSQDAVVYRWLSDPTAWGVDISQLLKQGRVNQVLKLLSPTWTSLGYGIETNSMTGYLPQIYQRVLHEELQGMTTPSSTSSPKPR